MNDVRLLMVEHGDERINGARVRIDRMKASESRGVRGRGWMRSRVMGTGTVSAIVVKTEHRGPLEETDSVRVDEGGLEGNVGTAGHRRVTFISAEQWAETTAELGTELPWHTRRANVLLEGVRAPDLMGKVLKIGEIEIQINGETEPCGRMDEIHTGLRKALEPECRGGVYGHVVSGGTLNVGDTVEVSGQSNP